MKNKEKETNNKVVANDENNQKEKQVKESDLTLQEVFDKSTEANKELKSFSSKMDMDQQMEVDGESFDIKMKADMKYITDPITLHQVMTTSMDMGQGNGEEKIEMEAYLTDKGFYMFEPTEKMWIKLPVEMTDQLLQLQDGQTNPSDQLEQLKTFVDDFDFKQDNSQYILHLKADGEKFTDFIKETAMNSMPAEMQDPELFEGMDINAVEYEIFIDKETFYTTKMNIKMDTTLNMDGQKMSMRQNIKSDYADYNKIDSIEVPQEALDNAQEIDFNDLENQ
ncbi:DUF6612 family protein [Lederbergia lenta]|uniref:Outer membrane lipoprotein carrier protein LolA n=1 Tax=Lederbergia lenta TaxID=1467 RepID=A0A2X4WDV5_LEDLE|nr:DUF6612 family protein [Lederbergia lenta]MEC2326424.1 hypothetical protein [Lederbergia lenta]SQI61361.1 Uncharacterised protein [Lederbergia lenta]